MDSLHGARVAAHDAVSAALSRCGPAELRELVERAKPLGSGIGGSSSLMEVGGIPVFVKRLPLTDLELLPENVRSTANVFGLPTSCHYGVGLIGGPGFGAWRELAVHTMTTGWVLSREYEGFPLMYHWRVLPHPGQSLPDELADVDEVVAYWGGSPELRGRLEALRDASASIALFLEYIPQNLHDWLGAQVAAGDEAIVRACRLVEEQLRAGVSFMNSRGLLHFDGHFQNILTDGERLYFADYGLAISSRFDLSEEEAGFLADHRDYDLRYTATHLFLWLTTALRSAAVPPEVAALLARHAPVAGVMTDFYRRFRYESRQTPYPAGELRSVR